MNGTTGHLDPNAAPLVAYDAPPAQADWAQMHERSNPFALRVMSFVVRVCGRRVARWALHPIALYFLLAASGPRRCARRFLSRALGRPAHALDLYRHLHCFAATVLDRVYLLRGRLDLFDIRIERESVIDATLSEGRGAFLLGAHMGSFEALRAVGASRPGLAIAMVMYPDNARLIHGALAALAPEHAPRIISLGRSDSTLAIRDWLDAGGLAGVLADRAPPAGARCAGTVRLSFLGKEATFSDGPFRLAQLLRRRVIFMAGLYRGGNRYDVRFETLADFSAGSESAAERERRVQEAVRAYAARLEALALECPYNWFNFYDFWDEDDAR